MNPVKLEKARKILSKGVRCLQKEHYDQSLRYMNQFYQLVSLPMITPSDRAVSAGPLESSGEKQNQAKAAHQDWTMQDIVDQSNENVMQDAQMGKAGGASGSKIYSSEEKQKLQETGKAMASKQLGVEVGKDVEEIMAAELGGDRLSKNISKLNHIQGHIYYHLGDYESSLLSYEVALQCLPKEESVFEEGLLYMNTSETFIQMHYVEEAIAQSKLAIERLGEGGHELIGGIYNNLAGYYKVKGDIATALGYSEKSLESLAEQLGFESEYTQGSFLNHIHLMELDGKDKEDIEAFEAAWKAKGLQDIPQVDFASLEKDPEVQKVIEAVKGQMKGKALDPKGMLVDDGVLAKEFQAFMKGQDVKGQHPDQIVHFIDHMVAQMKEK